MKRFRVNVDGQSFEVEVEEIGAGSVGQVETKPAPSAAPAPKPAAPAPKPATPAPKPAAGGAAGSINAPMPGNILSVKVNEGDQVKAGQVLLILEAMKMENEIVAPKDGVVNKIYVATGQSVSTSDPLVALG